MQTTMISARTIHPGMILNGALGFFYVTSMKFTRDYKGYLAISVSGNNLTTGETWENVFYPPDEKFSVLSRDNDPIITAWANIPSLNLPL